MKVPSFRHLTDRELTTTVADLVHRERRATADVIASIDEFDRRRLFLPAGFASMFVYCTKHLHLGEGAAYSRIEAARAARRFPIIYDLLVAGDITLSTIGLLARHLTERNHLALLNEARHKSKRDVEIIVARLAPKPDAPSAVRKLPVVRPSLKAGVAVQAPRLPAAPAPIPAAPLPDGIPAPPPRPVIAPLAPERFKLQITMSQETHDTLRQLQNLMRHAVPSGDVAVIIERALELLLQEVLRRKCGMRKRDLPSQDSQQPEPGGHWPLLH